MTNLSEPQLLISQGYFTPNSATDFIGSALSWKYRPVIIKLLKKLGIICMFNGFTSHVQFARIFATRTTPVLFQQASFCWRYGSHRKHAQNKTRNCGESSVDLLCSAARANDGKAVEYICLTNLRLPHARAYEENQLPRFFSSTRE
jgi:hypothetical protein